MSQLKINVKTFKNEQEANKVLKEWVGHCKKEEPVALSAYLASYGLMDRLKGKTRYDLVAADLSGMKIAHQNFRGLDFGEVFLENTTFHNCDMVASKLSSKAKMKGLSFEAVTLNDAKIIGDVSGVSIQGLENNNSDITNLDLSEAYGITNLKIAPNGIKGKNIRVPFVSQKAFYKHDDKKKKNFEKAAEYDISERGARDPNFISLVDMGKNVGQGLADVTKQTAELAGRAAVGAANLAGNAVHTAKEAAIQPNIPTSRAGWWQVGKNAWDGVTNLFSRESQEEVSSAEHPQNTNSQENPPQISDKFQYALAEDIKDNNLSLDDVKSWIQSKDKTKSLEDFAKQNDKRPIIHGTSLDNIEFNNRKFGDVKCYEAEFNNCSFNQCDLQNTSIIDSKMNNCRLYEIKANGVKLDRSILDNCTIDKSNMEHASFLESTIAKSNIQNTRLQNTNLQHADLDNVSMEVVDLNNALMNDLNAKSLIMKRVSAQNVDLSNAMLIEPKMNLVDLSNSIANKAAMPGAKISDSTWNKLQAQGLEIPRSTISGTNISNSDLSFADISNSALSEVKIDNSNLTKVNASGLDNEAQGWTNTKIYNSQAEGINFTDAKFVGQTQIVKSDLSCSNMQNTKIVPQALNKDIKVQAPKSRLDKSVHREMPLIQESNFYGANLNQARMDGVKIDNSSLVGSNLTDAVISGGILDKINLSGANMERSTIGKNGNHTEFTSIDGLTLSSDTKIDASTKFQAPNQEINYVKNSGKTKTMLYSEAEERAKQSQDINQTGYIRSAGREVVKFLAAGFNAANAVFKPTSKAANMAQNRKKSFTGTLVGIGVGLGAGALITGVSIASLGAVPAAVGAVLGGCALAGGIIGRVSTSTASGRRLLVGAGTAAAGMAFGPIGLAAAPFLIGYNVISRKSNPISKGLAASSGLVANLAKNTSKRLNSLVYSDKDLDRAYNVARIQNYNKAQLEQKNREIAAKQIDNRNIANNRVKKFFSRPFTKRSKKEQEVGIMKEFKPMRSRAESVASLGSYKSAEDNTITSEKQAIYREPQTGGTKPSGLTKDDLAKLDQETKALESREDRMRGWMDGKLFHTQNSDREASSKASSISSDSTFEDAKSEASIETVRPIKRPSQTRSRTSSVSSTESFVSAADSFSDDKTVIAEEKPTPTRHRAATFASRIKKEDYNVGDEEDTGTDKKPPRRSTIAAFVKKGKNALSPQKVKQRRKSEKAAKKEK